MSDPLNNPPQPSNTGGQPIGQAGNSVGNTGRNSGGSKRVIIIIVTVCGLGLLLLAGWWLRGRVVWTDDRTIRISTWQAEPRRILWTKPKPLDKPLNTKEHEYLPTLSPDGTELYFVRGKPGGDADIYRSVRQDNAWTEPEPIEALNSAHDDLGPRLSTDGNWLLLFSNRPGGRGQFDLWASKRGKDGWGKPVNLGPNINSEYNEYSATLSADGKRIYFSSNRKSATRDKPKEAWSATLRENFASTDFDLYSADLVQPTAQPPVETDPETDPEAGTDPETKPKVEPDPELNFQSAREMVELNTTANEGAPTVTAGGDFLYFASNRPGGVGGFDIYRVRLFDDQIGEIEPVGDLNTIANDMDPQLVMGGFRIFFSSDRDNSQGGYDLFNADAREVYVQRNDRSMNIWTWWWVLLLALIMLLVLTHFLRDADNRLSILHKCILFSLLLHMLLLAMFSGMKLTENIYEVIKEESGQMVAVNLNVSTEIDVRSEIRKQQQDLLVPVPPPSQFVQSQQAPPAFDPPQIKRNIPKTPIRPSTISTAAAMPKPVTPQPVEELPLPAPPIKVVPDPQFKAPSPLARVQAKADAQPRPKTDPKVAKAATEPAKTNPVQTKSTKPQQTKIDIQSLAKISPLKRPPSEAVEQLPTDSIDPSSVALVTPKLQSDAEPLAAQVSAAKPYVTATEVQTQKQSTATSSPLGEPSVEHLAVSASQVIKQSTVAIVALPRTASAPAPSPPSIDPPDAFDELPVGPPSIASPKAVTEPTVADSFSEPTPTFANKPISDAKFDDPTPAESKPSIRPARRTGDSLLSDDSSPLRLAKHTDLPFEDFAPSIDDLVRTPDVGNHSSPDRLTQRSYSQRKPLLKKMGGNEKSEDSVARALAYLARQQEPGGRWTNVRDDKPPGKRGPWQHDAAVTGLALLSFLAADHTPDKPGPYRETVRQAIEYLIEIQRDNGDLRNGGDMYDQGIATLALVEVAIMSPNPEYRKAAHRAAKFIVDAQNKKTGGWRYKPGAPSGGGDTSVVGWQVMALHAARRTGFKVPDATIKGAFKWLDKVTPSKKRMRAGYQGGETPIMTAEAALCRVLLGQKFSEKQIKSIGDYLLDHPPGKGENNYYYWYYGSLVLHQMQGDAWPKWNEKMQKYLTKRQRKGGFGDGGFDTRSKWGSRGGRIYSTAMATLVLEVYYRYLPRYLEKD